MKIPVWKKISEKTLFQNDYWTYKVDEFEIPGTVKGEYHYVHTNGSTLIIPINTSKQIIFVRQYRYLNSKESLEFPCGLMEPKLTLIENAQKELREETGFSSNNLRYIGAFAPYTGASDEMCYVYLGLDLHHSPLPSDKTETIIVEYYSFEKIERMMMNNEIWDGLTLSAWMITKEKIKKYLG
jgi:ADP-ribose pyrophosphatase